jgi:glutathione S-transferase
MQLFVLHVSPWSERARWALDHHGISYRLVQHAPFLGERRLRKVAGPSDGPVTVPVLVDGATVIRESWDIVVFADRRGNGTTLIPPDGEDEIREWTRIVDVASGRGRAIVVGGMLRNPRALDESHPPAVPGFMRPLLRPITRYGTRWFGRKYGLDLDDVEGPKKAVRECLLEMRARLGGKPYMRAEFGYADIVSAGFLQAIAPVGDEYIRLGPGTREVWTQPELASEFVDLIRWRDELYREHRRPRVKP